jgi:hypothetical protein
MNDSAKLNFISSYFDNLRRRFENLPKLHAQPSFRDEAMILCLVYIDGLASKYYGSSSTKGNFCKALRELSGNPLFGKLHPKVLLDPDKDKYWAGAKPAVEELTTSKPGELLDEAEVAATIRASGVDKQTEEKLLKNLWRCSVGAICYDVMRTSAVHRLGAGTLTFDETLYQGELGFALTFDLLYAALGRISDHIAKESVEKGDWFGGNAL